MPRRVTNGGMSPVLPFSLLITEPKLGCPATRFTCSVYPLMT
jgi:hypothetical protein